MRALVTGASRGLGLGLGLLSGIDPPVWGH